MNISTIARRFRRERRYQVGGAIAVAAAVSLGGVLLTVHGGSGQARPVTVDSSYSVSVMDLGSMPKDHHTLRIVSAHGDLTGQRELKWAADTGHPVGTARCTKKFRIGNQPSASVKPTMLLCWRLSPNRSVFTVAVDVDHPPSEQASVAKINEVWRQLGD
jgi:hypothetical protein